MKNNEYFDEPIFYENKIEKEFDVIKEKLNIKETLIKIWQKEQEKLDADIFPKIIMVDNNENK